MKTIAGAGHGDRASDCLAPARGRNAWGVRTRTFQSRVTPKLRVSLPGLLGHAADRGWSQRRTCRLLDLGELRKRWWRTRVEVEDLTEVESAFLFALEVEERPEVIDERETAQLREALLAADTEDIDAAVDDRQLPLLLPIPEKRPPVAFALDKGVPGRLHIAQHSSHRQGPDRDPVSATSRANGRTRRRSPTPATPATPGPSSTGWCSPATTAYACTPRSTTSLPATNTKQSPRPYARNSVTGWTKPVITTSRPPQSESRDTGQQGRPSPCERSSTCRAGGAAAQAMYSVHPRTDWNPTCVRSGNDLPADLRNFDSEPGDGLSRRPRQRSGLAPLGGPHCPSSEIQAVPSSIWSRSYRSWSSRTLLTPSP